MSYAMNHAISAYRTAATAVAPPVAVTLLLDEVLNAIVLGAKHLRKKEYEDSQLRIARATGILRGLRQNVDPDIDRKIGRQFIEMYTRNIFALNRVAGKKDAVERLATLAEGLLEFRNAWAGQTPLSERSLTALQDEIYDRRIIAECF